MHKEKRDPGNKKQAGERLGVAKATPADSQRTATPTASRFWALVIQNDRVATCFEKTENSRQPVPIFSMKSGF